MSPSPSDRSEALGGGSEFVRRGETQERGLQLGHQVREEDVRSDASHDGHTHPGNLNIPGRNRDYKGISKTADFIKLVVVS